MERLIAVPSAALSISVLVLSAAIDSSTVSPPGTLGSLLGMGVGLGFNLSTLVPILTLVWHALTFLPHRPASRHCRSLSSSSVILVDENDVSTQTRIWTPHTLAIVWFFNTILMLAAPNWTSDNAFPFAGLAVLSGLEAGVLALGGVLAQYQIQRELQGDVDDECGWEEDDEVKPNEL